MQHQDLIWTPTNKDIEKTNIFKVMQNLQLKDYPDFLKWSTTNRSDFWDKTIQNLDIQMQEKYTAVFDLKEGVKKPKWLPNAKLNIVDSCFLNADDAIAVIYQKEGEELKKISQKELENFVNQIANSLVNQGLQKGDFIAIDMPMTVEAVAIYLAGIKAGIPVATVADSFTPNEIAVRLQITKPKLVFTQDVQLRAGKKLPLYQKVIDAKASKIVVIPALENLHVSLRKQDILWQDFLVENNKFTSVKQTPEETITVLFSSGTTGAPKAIPWNHTTPIKAASDGFYHHDVHQNEVIAWPTNLGWMMGPWLVFAALINKATIALYYGAPTGREFGEFVTNAKINMLGLVPSIVKHWKHTKCMEGLNWDSIKCFSSTGEASNPIEYKYLSGLANNKPIIEYCGGTEIGGGYVTSTLVQPNIASVFSTQALGTEFVLLDENYQPTDKGEVFLVPPILGLSNTLLNRDHEVVYFKDTPKWKGKVLRRHGDQLEHIGNGYYKAQGRVDDAMNLGGIKVSSLQIEAVVNSLDFVKEAAAVAVSPKDGGPSVLVVYFVENKSNTDETAYFDSVKNAIRNKLNPLFKLSDLRKIDSLPRTASGKVMRKNLRKEYENHLL
ncbi:MAG TPA: AMP-dependent synthetase [Flavobacteriia bacterium]|nr:AMP-dependent synthetase [Flavobacteriia bacterium]